MKLPISGQPLLRRKQEALDVQDLQGSWRLHWQLGDLTLFSSVYTRIDQVFVIWGLMAIAMFTVAQFSPISWVTQATVWSLLSGLGVISMIGLTTFWAKVERLLWLVYVWAGLMIAGVVLTDLGIFLNWGSVLLNLCPLWLGLSAIGYFCTGFAIQSRTFSWLGAIHIAGLWYVQQILSWQYLATGMIIGGSLLLLAQMQWDMRPPIDYALLSEQQKAFNHQQYARRQRINEGSFASN